ncbi:hypothetical protein AKJ16_DCAP06425 [Drosera capensis]
MRDINNMVFGYNLFVPFGRQMFGIKWEKELERRSVSHSRTQGFEYATEGEKFSQQGELEHGGDMKPSVSCTSVQRHLALSPYQAIAGEELQIPPLSCS